MFRITCLTLCILYLCNVVLSDIKTDLLPSEKECGKQKSEDRIYGGEECKLGEFPWLALLMLHIPAQDKYIPFCGGTLINNRYVLTAAHCFQDLPNPLPSHLKLIVRLGEHNFTSAEDCDDDNPELAECADPPVNFGVEKQISHEQYIPHHHDFYNDIALLRLDNEVTYSEFIKPICLPIPSEVKEKDFTDDTVTVTGWGVTENKTQSDVKLKVDLPVRGNKACNRIYKTVTDTTGIIDKQLCAGGQEGKDTCQGDSGGPVLFKHVADEETQWYTIGVVSYGLGCGNAFIPGVYTRVTEYLDWITNHLEP